MKIAYITPGSGDTFYCQNCFRDDEMLSTMLLMGQDIRKIPMYLPSGYERDGEPKTPVFYGAVNLYLREKLPIYRHAPDWLGRALDSQALLKLAAKKSGSTKPTGLEGMTISMLRGEEGRQASELDTLIRYLRDEIRPDIVHLSNALLLGLTHRLKHDLNARVVCSLQDENEWIDEMGPSHQSEVWGLMAEKAREVDLFVTTSRFYSEKSQRELRVPADRIRVINGGINLDGYRPSSLPFDPPVIGYLCRISAYFGTGILVDAFLELKRDSRFRDLRLHLTGGHTAFDKPYVTAQVDKLNRAGHGDDFEIFPEFNKPHRIRFLESLTLLSVPVPTGEAFGAYQVEALAAGVPVVQPDVGCYPEFVEATGGGVIYRPNTPEALAEALAALLSDPERVRRMGEEGRRVVMARYSMREMARSIVGMYETLMGGPA